VRFNDLKCLLKETATTMKKFGVDPTTNYNQVLADDSMFSVYTESLAEGLSGDVKNEFMELSGHVREGMLLETVYGFNPQAPLIMPIFRKYWPALVAREALTVIPMDKPDLVRMFMLAFAKTRSGAEIALPNLTTPVSTAQDFGVVTPYVVTLPSTTDILAAHAMTSDEAHLQKDFIIAGVNYLDNTGTARTLDVEVEPDDDGNFAFEVAVGGGAVDYVSGNVDYFSGIVSASSTSAALTDSKAVSLIVVGSISTAEELYANKINFKHVKIRMSAIDHEIQAEWTIQYEQDTKAYFDLDVQAQLVDTFGNAVAMDIDRALINKLIRETEKFNSGNIKTFSKTPEPGFAFGRTQWANEIVMPLREVSGKIYTDTNIGVGNTLIANPLDVEYLKSANDHTFDVNGVDGGQIGANPVAGRLDSSWKVLSTNIMPRGKMLVMLKPDNPDQAVFVYAPYRPLTITPWPMGRKPAMTFLSRYASRFIRREGVGILNITA